MSSLICPLCSNEQTAHLNFTLSTFLRHVELFHSHEPTFLITCGLNGCLRQFRNFRVFRNHVYTFHSGDPNLANVSSGNGTTDNTPAITNTEDEDDVNSSSMPERINLHDLQKSTALFLMGSKEKYKLTQVALQGIIDGVTSLMKARLSVLHHQIFSVLPHDLSEDVTDEIEGLFSADDGTYSSPFHGLETQHQQEAFYRTHFNFVVRICV